MNDDDLTELILRASAYLDGELDAAETARVEADPAVMAGVAQLRALQADVRFVDPPTSAARESAMAAALAEFDALHAPAARLEAVPPTRVVPYRPRPAYTRWLSVAAAVVGVGVLGVVITNASGGGDDDEAGSAVFDASSATIEPGNSRIAEATAEASFAEESAAEAASTAGGDAALSAPAGTPAPEVLASGSAEDTAAADESAPATTAAASAFPPFDPERPIADELELAAVGTELLAREAAGTLGATPETRCDLDPFDELSFGRYQTGGDVREVLVAVDRTTLQTAAYDADTCELVASSPAP
jgi:anti-sigma factor RsiW